VSLEVLLTPSRLRALAGYAYARGEQYMRTGRVRACARTDGGLDGIVVGSALYRVRVHASERALHAECTCPVGGPMCKHAVALALWHLEQTTPAPEPGEPGGPASAGDGFATRKELAAWAEAHHVAHELVMSAERLLPELTGYAHAHQLRYALGRVAIIDVGSREGAQRYLGVRALVDRVPAVVKARLEAAAAEVRAGLAEEELSRMPPRDPVVAKLWAALGELRATVRAEAYPRGRAVRAGGTLDLDARAAALVWKEPWKLAMVDGVFTSTAIVTRLVGTPKLALACSCKRAACTHGLALIDAARDLLGDPSQQAEARRIADELLRPAWQRALAELARHDEEPRPAIEVWWQIEHELGAPTVTPLVKKQLKKGGMSAGARMSATKLLEEHGSQLGATDAQIAEIVAAWQPAPRVTTYPSRAFLALVGHPRVTTAEDPDVPLQVVRAPLGFTASPAGDEIRLEPWIDGARFSPRLLQPLLQLFAPTEPLFVVEPERGRCLLIEVGDDARRVWQVLDKHGDSFPPESHGALLDRLARLGSRVPLEIPSTIKGARLALAPVVVARVRLLPDASLELEPFVRPAPGAPLFPPGAGPREVIVVKDGDRGYVRRDLDAEGPLVAGLLARLPLDDAEEGPPGCFRLADTDAALALVAALQAPPPGLEAEWLDGKPTIVGTALPADLKIRVEKRRDWFGLDGEIRVDAGRLELAVVLDAARRQQRFVRVDEDRWLELSDALRARLAPVSERTFASKQGLELSPGAVTAIRELAESGAKVDSAAAWQQLTERMQAASKLRPRPPAALAKTLRPYQAEGHAWLTRLAAWGAGGCLADDMGLGKTVQAIAVLLDRAKLGPALVLAPTSVTLNWVDELRRFAPGLRPVVYGEVPDRAACIASLGKKDVLIASYGLLARDAELLAGRPFATLVLDEAQALKNPTTQRAKAARRLQAGFRIALTGTPLENHLGELWSLFSIVFPGLLGSWEQFRKRFALPIERTKSDEARQALSSLIKPFLLRRTKAEVARELPPRTEIHVPIALSDEERALYEDARLAAIASLTKAKVARPHEKQRFEVLAALTRLRLLASHPKLYDPSSTVPSSKLARLVELVDELRSGGHRALVFSQFTSHLALVRPALDAAGVRSLYLDGSTPTAERKRLIQRFQGGEGEVFLISLKAGGTGINLTAADYVIHLDPWWNPAVEDQATDRAHRIGQERPVTVYRLVSRGTVEDKILALHADKRALVAGVLDGTNAAARLGTREMLELLEHAGDVA